jgi:hypothetical protein
MPLDRPIVMVGTGRCGSTMLHRLLARHDHLGWLSTLNEVLPTQAWLSRFANVYRWPALSLKTRHAKVFPKPFECYRYWEHFLPGFSRRDRPQVAADVVEAGIEACNRSLEKILRAQGRDRILVKVTGWSRVAYFDRLLPKPLFVALHREHRAVVSSWVQAGWLDVTSGLDDEGWQWGEVPPAYEQVWRDLGATPILSAALKIQLDLDDIRRNLPLVPGRAYEMQYEDLIANPVATLKALLEFCQLPWTPQFEDEVARMKFYNPANKWKQYLSEEQGECILEFFQRCEAASD